MKKLLIAMALIATLTGTAQAELATLKCAFPNYASPSGYKSSKNFKFTLQVDTITNKAFIVGNAGLSPVVMHKGDLAITFIEYLTSGVAQTTSVQLKTGQSIHSRHSMTFLGDVIPSQYYGTCK